MCSSLKILWHCLSLRLDFPGGSDDKNICLQCGRPGFDPWVGKIPWRRKWQSTPVLLPGKSHGQRSLAGCSPWDRKESDTTERLHFHFLWDWNENTFLSPVTTAEFSKFAGILSAAHSHHHLLGFEITQLEFITSISFVHSDAF